MIRITKPEFMLKNRRYYPLNDDAREVLRYKEKRTSYLTRKEMNEAIRYMPDVAFTIR